MRRALAVAISRRRRRWRARGGAPSALHNNCSGKHAGFICVACAAGVDHRGYVAAEHPVQREVRAALEGLTGVGLGSDQCGIDGCSIPTWAVPLDRAGACLRALRHRARARPERAKAAARLRAACAAQPYYVAGTGRFCTEIMKLFGPRAGEDRRGEDWRWARCPSRARHRAQMRGRRDARRRSRDGGDDRALSAAADDERRALDRFCASRRCATGTAIEVGGLSGGGCASLLSSRATKARAGTHVVAPVARLDPGICAGGSAGMTAQPATPAHACRAAPTAAPSAAAFPTCIAAWRTVVRRPKPESLSSSRSRTSSRPGRGRRAHSHASEPADPVAGLRQRHAHVPASALAWRAARAPSSRRTPSGSRRA